MEKVRTGGNDAVAQSRGRNIVLEDLGTFSALIAVILYFADSGNRRKQKHYQAWPVINTAQGKGGSGGRIEALQELNADHVSLIGIEVNGAFLQGLSIRRAGVLSFKRRSSHLCWSELVAR
jgi:hypothetical protein